MRGLTFPPEVIDDLERLESIVGPIHEVRAAIEQRHYQATKDGAIGRLIRIALELAEDDGSRPAS
jgi:hypothetical protein